MSTNDIRKLRKLAVIGAGNMGSGIAQKMATEGFDVTLVDLDAEKVSRGIETIDRTLAEGVERRIFRPEQAEAIRGRVRGTHDWNELATADLVVEAVFEDLDVKREVFAKLEAACPAETILATNTSSFAVSDIARATRSPGRVLGLHYFYHPAKNRLVEVVPGRDTDAAVVRAAWSLQEQLGKTPIASADAYGFVVNRFFVPWLNEAVRLLEEGVAEIPTIEAACKQTFGVGMGPFELMNVTGVPIAMHSATTLGQQFGPFYAPAARLRQQVTSGENWELGGAADASGFDAVSERMLGVVFYVAGALVDEQVGTIEDTDIGARVGLRWPRGPFQMMNRSGVERAVGLVREITARWELTLPRVLEAQLASGVKFTFRVVTSTVQDGIATLTINRPDAMNALNEAVVAQLHAAFRAAATDPAVRGIVIAGTGKAFIAGADIRFFVRNIEAKTLDRIQSFTEAGHALLNDIAACPKRVVARVHGLALGGGLELALACHAIIASPKASMAFPETGIGIYPGLGGTQRTPRRVGAGLAKWLIYSGQMVTAEQAQTIGLVDEVVPHDELDVAVSRAARGGTMPRDRDALPAPLLAVERFFEAHSAEALRRGQVDAKGDAGAEKALKKIAGKAPVALEIAEQLIDDAGKVSLEEGLRLELAQLDRIFNTDDAYEGLSSLGKKKPVFAGS